MSTLACLFLATAAAADQPLSATAAARFDTAVDYCLDAQGATRSDLALRTDYLDPDPLRLPLLEEAMHNPLELPFRAAEEAACLRSATEPTAVLDLCRAQLPSATVQTGAKPITVLLPGRLERALGRLPEDASGELRDRLEATLAAILEADRQVRAGLEEISADTRARIVTELPEALLREGSTPDPDRQEQPDTLESARRMRELVTDFARLDVGPFLDAGSLLLAAAQTWRDVAPLPATAEHAAWLDVETRAGRVLVTGPGNDVTVLDSTTALLLDLGGDDIVIDRAGFAPGRVRLHIDLGGNDRLVCTTPGAGAALLGASVVLDREGNDTYEASHYTGGVGLAGVGVLWDAAGNDLYIGDTVAQGAGMLGLGLLIDEAGNDRYLGQSCAQGFGGPGGVGLLLDRAGKDLYQTGYHYPDDIGRQPPGYITLSQGFGYGFRPYCAGGNGWLVDVEGDDAYLADYFGQGAAYWLAVGALVDLDGNDRYEAMRYCQGAGIHLAAGVLLDTGGDDRYDSWGVSLGTGHDLGPGILFDAAGNDRYASAWLSVGAGNGNGLGVFFEADGDDRYLFANDWSNAGFGQYFDLREDGSFGLAADAHGKDTYDARGADNRWWGGGAWGMAVDLEVEP